MEDISLDVFADEEERERQLTRLYQKYTLLFITFLVYASLLAGLIYYLGWNRVYIYCLLGAGSGLMMGAAARIAPFGKMMVLLFGGVFYLPATAVYLSYLQSAVSPWMKKALFLFASFTASLFLSFVFCLMITYLGSAFEKQQQEKLINETGEKNAPENEANPA